MTAFWRLFRERNIIFVTLACCIVFYGAEKFMGLYWSFLFLIALFVLAYVGYNFTRWGAYVVTFGNCQVRRCP